MKVLGLVRLYQLGGQSAVGLGTMDLDTVAATLGIDNTDNAVLMEACDGCLCPKLIQFYYEQRTSCGPVI
jgi:hypothetical protein